MTEMIARTSKAIAAMLAAILAMWINAVFSFDMPADMITTTEGAIAAVVAGAIGFVITYISPRNKDAPKKD